MLKPTQKALIEIHLAALLFGFVSIFAKFVSLPAYEIVFWRTLFGAISLWIVILLTRGNVKLKSLKDFGTLVVLAGLLAIHWTAFFKSIQVSTIATALLTTYTYPILMVFMESALFKEEKIKRVDLISAGIAFLGIVFLVPEFDFSNHIFQGVLWGLLAGFMNPCTILIRKKYLVKKYPGIFISAFELSLVSLILLPFVFVGNHGLNLPSNQNLTYLILLGVLFSSLPRTLCIQSQRWLTGKTVSLILMLEVVYGIVLGVVLVKEIPAAREWIGGIIIVSVIVIETLKIRKKSGEILEQTP